RKAGVPGERPEFHPEISAKHLQAAGISPDDAGTFFHLSPFTKTDEKELLLDKIVAVIEALHEQFPKKRLAISCAPDQGERRKMETLLARLKTKPWRILPGNLNLVQLAALIQQSALHLSGDTGTLH